MNINFKRVEIHNFMSFSDEIFDIENYSGLNLIQGVNKDIPGQRNAAGKSCLIASIVYGIYGQLPVTIKASNIANRNISDKEVRVVVYLNVSNKDYKAVSGQNKRSQGFFQLFEIENGEEKDITRSTIAETREYFENEILHCDMSLFLRTVLLTSEQNYNFFKLKAAPKKEFIEKLFNIGVFGDMYDIIHRDVLDYDKRILGHQNQLIVLQNSEDEYKNKISEYDENKDKSIREYKERLTEAIAEYEEKKNSVVEKNETLIKKCEDAMELCKDAALKNKESIQKFDSNIQKEQQTIRFNEREKSDKQNTLNKHASLIGKLCEDCKGIYKDHYKISGFQDDITRCDSEISNARKLIEESESKKVAFVTKNSEIKEKYSKLSAKKTELLTEYENGQMEVRNLENNVNSIRNKIEYTEKQENPYIKLLENNKTKIVSEREELEKIVGTYKYIKYAEGIVSQENLRKFIIKDLLGLINNKIKYYLSKLGTKYDCVFDENLDYKFTTESGPCEYGNFSCGEQFRLSIAVNLAFRDFMAQRSNISSNILMIDEYLDSALDSMSIQSIIDILHDYVKQNNQKIFIISHRTEINNEDFSSIITVEKENGISHIS